MFISQKSKANKRVYFSKIEQKGNGIDPDLEKIIKNTIIAVETTKTCQCTGLPKKISDFLGKYNGEQWSVFCANTTQIYEFNVYIRKDAYIYTRPRKCNYAIYQTWLSRMIWTIKDITIITFQLWAFCSFFALPNTLSFPLSSQKYKATILASRMRQVPIQLKPRSLTSSTSSTQPAHSIEVIPQLVSTTFPNKWTRPSAYQAMGSP